MSLLNYAAIGYCKERKKRGKKVTGTVVWVGGYDLVDVTIVYGSNFFLCVCTRRELLLLLLYSSH